MIKDLFDVKIDNKKYIPLVETMDDLEKHLTNEMKDVSAEDKHGFELAIHETIVHLNNYL